MTHVARGIASVSLGLALALMASGCSKAPKSLNEKMQQKANLAAEAIKTETGLVLDYSIQSVKFVEQTLNRVAERVGKTDPAKASAEAETYGAYVGECLRKKHGGEWAEEQAEGKSVYQVKTPSGTAFAPVTWCYERITGTEKQNIYKKVQAEIAALEKK